MIRLTELTLTIRLYGQCTSPRKLTGCFTILLGDSITAPVDIFEGHVNSSHLRRLISFDDTTENGLLTKYFNSVKMSAVEIESSAGKFIFTIERVSIEVIGLCDKDATEFHYRGKMESNLDSGDVFSLYETDSSGSRRFYVDAKHEVITRAQQCIRTDGYFDLIECSVSNS